MSTQSLCFLVFKLPITSSRTTSGCFRRPSNARLEATFPPTLAEGKPKQHAFTWPRDMTLPRCRRTSLPATPPLFFRQAAPQRWTTSCQGAGRCLAEEDTSRKRGEQSASLWGAFQESQGQAAGCRPSPQRRPSTSAS